RLTRWRSPTRRWLSAAASSLAAGAPFSFRPRAGNNPRMPLTSFERLLEGQRLPAQPSRELIRREYSYFLRRLAIAGLLLAILMVTGATAYSAFEDESWWRGFIRAFETVTTLGSAGSPSSLGGQITEIVVITLGLGTLLYLLGTITELLVTGHR